MTRTCSSCGVKRTNNFYAGSNTECSVCFLNAEFAEETELRCAQCNVVVRATTGPGEENTLCSKCAKSKHIACSICKRSQPATNFSKYARTASAIARCRECSVACTQCRKTCTTAHMFATGTSLCWRCYKAPKICSRTCSRCDQQLSIENFDNKNVSAYDAKEMKFLVCRACYEKGYRYDNIEEIRCRHGHSRGRAAFDKKSLSNLKTQGTIPACLSCQSQRLCEACGVRKDPDKFDTRILHHAKSDGRKLVCLACQAIGYSPRDCAIYFCVGSQSTGPHQAGHLKFTHTALDR